TAELGDALDKETEKLVHKTIRKVTSDIENLRFNTAVSAMMIVTRRLAEQSPVPRRRDEVVEIAVQVNGRVRGRIKIAPDAPEDEARRAAEAEPNVMQHTAGKPIKKFLYVPGRIVNLLL